jgi:hypothetical protein
MTRFTVNKGKHKFHPRLPEFGNSKGVKFRANFDRSCLYDLKTVDQADINKLYGVTSLFIHKNSARFGWRAEGDVIRIFAYWYRKGIRGWSNLGIVAVDEWNDYSLTLENDIWVFTLNDKILKTTNINWWSFLTFKAFPFFGGNRKAPHSMDIGLYEIQ